MSTAPRYRDTMNVQGVALRARAWTSKERKAETNRLAVIARSPMIQWDDAMAQWLADNSDMTAEAASNLDSIVLDLVCSEVVRANYAQNPKESPSSGSSSAGTTG